MKMPKEIKNEMLGVCGVNCLACSAYLDEKKPCPGCHALKEAHTRISCRDCLKKACAYEKGYKWCFECEKSPCSMLRNLSMRYLENYNIDILQNGIEAKEDMDVFLESQRKKFTCDRCGGVINQHRKRCSDCNKLFKDNKNK